MERERGAGGTAKVKAWRPVCWRRSQVRPGGRVVGNQGKTEGEAGR